MSGHLTGRNLERQIDDGHPPCLADASELPDVEQEQGKMR